MLRIVYYSAVTNTINSIHLAATEILKQLDEAGYPGILHLDAADHVDIEDPSGERLFLDNLWKADVLLVRLMGGLKSFPCWEEVRKNFRGDVFIVPAGVQGRTYAEKYNTLRGEDASAIAGYCLFGGKENSRNLLLYLLEKYSREKGFSIPDFSVFPPADLPYEGIYHPDFPDGTVDPDVYIFRKISGKRPVAGIWFHRGNWVNGNLQIIDDVIRACDENGMDVIPVFLSMGNESPGSLLPREVAEKFFLFDGFPLIDVHLNLMFFSLSQVGIDGESVDAFERNDRWFFKKYKIPVFQGMLSNESESDWADSDKGLNPVTITLSMALPELDGNITTVPVGFKERGLRDEKTGTRIIIHRGNQERIRRFVRLARGWAELGKIPDYEKRIAILFHNHPPQNSSIGSAYLLDSPETVWEIVRNLGERGYDVRNFPESSGALMEEIRSGLTNDTSWFSPEDVRTRAVGIFSSEDRQKHLASAFPDSGEASPARDATFAGERYIGGRIYGNVFIGIQPGREELHSPDSLVDSSYLDYYWWIQDVWKAHAIIHVGRHGSVEWLAGKGAGLSVTCGPDMALGNLPHIYVYVVNAPGEGLQAKRRGSAALVDHNIPSIDRSGLYGEMERLETLLEEYDEALLAGRGREEEIARRIREALEAGSTMGDISLGGKDDFQWIEQLRNTLDEVKNTQVRKALHVFGRDPVMGEQTGFLVSLSPFLRDVFEAYLKGKDELFSPVKMGRNDLLYHLHYRILEIFSSFSFNPERVVEVLEEFLKNPGLSPITLPPDSFKPFQKNLLDGLERVGGVTVPALENTHREMDSLLEALDGKAPPRGPAGTPTSGAVGVLPTGKNFYTLDPRRIPSDSAWSNGKRLGDSLINRYLKEKGEYPRKVGIVLWAGPIMRTRGDDIAEVLYLMGVRPLWNRSSGWVTDLEVIPLGELKRPRIDVMCKISGLFRDTLPSLIGLLDKAVGLTAFLDEPLEMNYIKAHVHQDLEESLREGLSEKQAVRESLFRVFGVKPQGYGSGVNQLVSSGNWADKKDLGNRYVEWGGWAYAPGFMGVEKRQLFSRQLKVLDAAVKNQDHRESDFMDSDDWYDYHGGMIAAAENLSGKAVAAYMGVTSRPGEIKTRTPGEEARLVFRSRILNPEWIQGMKKHGYKGALDISHALNNAFGWDAATGVVEDWMYDQFARTFLLNRENREWMEDSNPDAVRDMLERLLEAAQRGMWNPDEGLLDELKQLYMKNEESLEEYYEN